jgi:hypothetical protein
MPVNAPSTENGAVPSDAKRLAADAQRTFTDATGAALGVGVLIGLLLSSRR